MTKVAMQNVQFKNNFTLTTSFQAYNKYEKPNRKITPKRHILCQSFIILHMTSVIVVVVNFPFDCMFNFDQYVSIPIDNLSALNCIALHCIAMDFIYLILCAIFGLFTIKRASTLVLKQA